MKVPAWLGAVVMLLGAASVVRGQEVHYVTPNGSDGNSGTSSAPWRTLAKANNMAVAGDLVLISGGTYTDGIHPLNSGRPGSPITFQAAPGERVVLSTSTGVQLGANHSYIVIDGFEVHASYRVAELLGSSYITIRNCMLYGGRGSYEAFGLANASYCVIQDNYLNRQDPDAISGGGDGLAVIGKSHHNLIEGNTVTRCSHVAFASSYGGQANNVWRNNTAYENHTNYSLQDGVERSVFENNKGYYQGLVWTGGDGNCLQFTGTNCIIRFNTLYADTSTPFVQRKWMSVIGAGTGSDYGAHSVRFNKIYNNTIYGENDQKEWDKAGWRNDNYNTAAVQNDNAFTNNIFAAAPGVQIDDIDTTRTLDQMNNRYAGNLLWGAPGRSALIRYEFRGSNAIWSLGQAIRVKPTQWASSNAEANPMFVNTVGQGPAKDFTLQAGSPAIDAGVELTRATNTGSGTTTLVVEDAGYFTDGWGIPTVEGDSLKIGSEAPVGITRVDYATNTLTLNGARSWGQGARVFYYRGDRFQGNAPDIGSHESGGQAPPPPPPAAPSPPSLFSPANGAHSLEPDVTLRWSPVGFAQTFRIQVSRDANFTTNDFDVTTGDPFLALSSLNSATTYYWRVNATNAVGTSDWSQVWALTTADPGSPPANVLSNAAFDDGLISWFSYSNGQADFSVSSPGFNSANAGKLRIIAAGDNTQIFQYDLALEPNTKYVLRFSAYSKSGHDIDVTVAKHSPPYTSYGLSAAQFDLDTTWHTFTTEFTTANFSSPVNDARLRFWFAPYAAAGDEYYIDDVVLSSSLPVLLAPSPVAPPQRAADQPTNVTLRWQPRAEAFAYAVEVALDSGFVVKVASDTAVVDTQYQLSSLENFTTYYWRVKSRSGTGTSSFSPVYSFTTAPTFPSAPLFIELPIQSGLMPLEFTVVWSRIAGATGYHLQIASDSLYQSLELNDSTITDTVKQIGPLRHATTYYMHLRAFGPGGVGPFGSSIQFTASASQLSMPTLMPLPGRPDEQPIRVTIVWQPTPGATHYHLQLSTDLQFKVLFENDSTLTDTVAQVGPLSFATTYFVRVRAMNDHVASVFSWPYPFSTIPGPPPAPGQIVVMSQPEMTSVMLSWAQVPGAISYHIQVSGDSLFTTFVVDDSTLLDTTRTVASLDPSTRYFARVRVKGTGGMSEFSSMFAFTTAGSPPPSNAPRDYSLEQNFPNPFNPSTRIRYEVPSAVHVRIALFNTLGQQVQLLVDADHAAGRYEIELTGQRLASGIYLYLFEAGAYVQTRKLLLLK